MMNATCGCKPYVPATLVIKWCPPEFDCDGKPLNNLKGANVYGKGPGDCDYALIGSVDVPETCFKYQPPKDGMYSFLVRAVIWGAVVANGVRTSCLEMGPPSDAVEVSVEVTEPAKPKKPEVLVICP